MENPPPQLKITLIGGGHLAEGLLSGLIPATPTLPLLNLKDVTVTARRPERAAQLTERYSQLTVTTNNKDDRIWKVSSREMETAGREFLHVVFICTKPKDLEGVCAELHGVIGQQRKPPTVVTMAPGISVAQLEAWLPRGVLVVRSLPNTPMFVGQGATALFPNHNVSAAQLGQVSRVYRTVTPTVVVLKDEDHINIVGATCGSGPAFFFYLMDEMIAAMIRNGMAEGDARDLVTQTCIGSGVLARKTVEKSLSQLKSDVCVPGGSTIVAMNHLEVNGWGDHTAIALEKSTAKNRDMGK